MHLMVRKGQCETASSALRFQNARKAPSATETEKVGIAICPAEEIVADDFGGDEAEGDAIATVAQRKIGVRKPGMDANVSQPVFRFTEGAGPSIGYFQLQIRKQSSKFFYEGSGFLRNQCISALRVDEVFVFAADDDTSFGGGPQIEVRRAAIPNEALLVPSWNRRERFTDERVGALQGAGLGVQEGF